MIQILVCDKVYVTPQMRRKKMLYKIYFILSIILVISLFAYYIYQEYDRTVSEQVSHEILEGLDIKPMVADNSEQTEPSVTLENDVIVVVLNDNSQEEINVDELVASAQQQIEENQTNEAAVPPVYVGKDGTEYPVAAIIEIPKLGIKYPVLADWSDDLLNNAPCRYKGPERANQVGNFVIIGHNMRNEQQNKFFTNIHKLEMHDKIQLTDAISGEIVEYMVYKKEYIEDTDLRCLDQDTNGKKIVTLITCYNYGKQRTVIQAVET